MQEQSEGFKVLGIKNHQIRILYPVKLTFKCKGETKTFLDKEQLNKFITGRSALQEILKEVHKSQTLEVKEQPTDVKLILYMLKY